MDHFGEKIENNCKRFDYSCGSYGSHEILVSFCAFCSAPVRMDFTNDNHLQICFCCMLQHKFNKCISKLCINRDDFAETFLFLKLGNFLKLLSCDPFFCM